MHLAGSLLSLLLAAATAPAYAKQYTKTSDGVLLSKVRSLTVQQGKQTTGRRLDPAPQLTCVGGNGKGLYEVDVMQCKNAGSEYDPEDVQWTCHASVPPEFKLGSTEVVCEGYDSPEDQYVLKGSCSVEYRLILTDLGEERYPANFWGTRSKKKVDDGLGKPPPAHEIVDPTPKAGQVFKVVFWIVFLAVLVFILYSISRDHGGGGVRLPDIPRGGWGGGGDDDDDPPPPYTPRRSPPKARRGPSYSASPRTTNSGPGFWSGAGLGGAAGYAAGNYMAGRSARQQQQQQQQQNTYAGPGPSTYNQGGGSSWFGGGGGGAGPSNYGAGPSTFAGGGGSSFGGGGSSTPSSSRYESTGFGGTRRR